MLLFVSAASAVEPRDSMYFNSYGSSLSAIGNGSIRISFTCDSVGMAAQRNPRHLTPENIGTPTCAAEHHSAALLFWGGTKALCLHLSNLQQQNRFVRFLMEVEALC